MQAHEVSLFSTCVQYFLPRSSTSYYLPKALPSLFLGFILFYKDPLPSITPKPPKLASLSSSIVSRPLFPFQPFQSNSTHGGWQMILFWEKFCPWNVFGIFLSISVICLVGYFATTESPQSNEIIILPQAWKGIRYLRTEFHGSRVVLFQARQGPSLPNLDIMLGGVTISKTWTLIPAFWIGASDISS